MSGVTGDDWSHRAMRGEFFGRGAGVVPVVLHALDIGRFGGQPLDAPDYVPAGSCQRNERWVGNVGEAYPYFGIAGRS